MPIHLHIGTHKTGTTAIQRQLRRNREALKRRGIWYPSEAELLPGSEEKSIPHRRIAISLDNTKGPKPFTPDELRVMAKTLLQQSKCYRHTILSSEAFWRIGFAALPDHYSREELWLRKASNVEKVRRLFGDADVQIWAVLRERGAYIQSGYSEFILATLYTKGIDAFLHSYAHSWDYAQQLETWSTAFPVHALSYERLCSNHQLPLDFLRHLCGEDLPQACLQPDPRPRVNISDPLACVAFKRFLNQLPLHFHQRRKIYNKYNQIFLDAIRRTSISTQLRTLASINSWLHPADLRSLRQALAKGDQDIRRRFCPELVSQPTGWWASRSWSSAGARAMTAGDERQVIDWMLRRKPLKSSWFRIPEEESRR